MIIFYSLSENQKFCTFKTPRKPWDDVYFLVQVNLQVICKLDAKFKVIWRKIGWCFGEELEQDLEWFLSSFPLEGSASLDEKRERNGWWLKLLLEAWKLGAKVCEKSTPSSVARAFRIRFLSGLFHLCTKPSNRIFFLVLYYSFLVGQK